MQVDAIGLHDLRAKMGVIPQDSFVFSGSLRFNIDPLGEFADDRIFEILCKVRLAETLVADDGFDSAESQARNPKSGADGRARSNVQMQQFLTRESSQLSDSSPRPRYDRKAMLDYRIEDGGANLSVGQKQLICVARALIKKPEILLMDEATSNIDEHTDAIIQNVIREEFRDVTIGERVTPVTIAHRLKTVMHYDWIFVLDDGRLVEQGTPQSLLRSDGAFRKMVGPDHKELMRIAEAAKND